MRAPLPWSGADSRHRQPFAPGRTVEDRGVEACVCGEPFDYGLRLRPSVEIAGGAGQLAYAAVAITEAVSITVAIIVRRRFGAIDCGAAVGLFFPARLDRVVGFGFFKTAQQRGLALGREVGPVAVINGTGHRIEQVEAGPEAGALDLEEGLDRADAEQILGRAHADLTQPCRRFRTYVADLRIPPAIVALDADRDVDRRTRFSRF